VGRVWRRVVGWWGWVGDMMLVVSARRIWMCGCVFLLRLWMSDDGEEFWRTRLSKRKEG
jgi:hypothetical protein